MTILAFFASLMPLRGWLIAGAVVLGVAGAAVIVHQLKSQGAQDALTTINKANDDANTKALTGKDKALTDYDTCVANGGTWIRAQLVCQPASSR